MQGVVYAGAIMFSVILLKCRYANYRYSECRGTLSVWQTR